MPKDKDQTDCRDFASPCKILEMHRTGHVPSEKRYLSGKLHLNCSMSWIKKDTSRILPTLLTKIHHFFHPKAAIGKFFSFTFPHPFSAMLKAFTDWVLFRHWTPLRGLFLNMKRKAQYGCQALKPVNCCSEITELHRMWRRKPSNAKHQLHALR
jgi:hypothetical protein